MKYLSYFFVFLICTHNLANDWNLPDGTFVVASSHLGSGLDQTGDHWVFLISNNEPIPIVEHSPGYHNRFASVMATKTGKVFLLTQDLYTQNTYVNFSHGDRLVLEDLGRAAKFYDTGHHSQIVVWQNSPSDFKIGTLELFGNHQSNFDFKLTPFRQTLPFIVTNHGNQAIISPVNSYAFFSLSNNFLHFHRVNRFNKQVETEIEINWKKALTPFIHPSSADMIYPVQILTQQGRVGWVVFKNSLTHEWLLMPFEFSNNQFTLKPDQLFHHKNSQDIFEFVEVTNKGHLIFNHSELQSPTLSFHKLSPGHKSLNETTLIQKDLSLEQLATQFKLREEIRRQSLREMRAFNRSFPQLTLSSQQSRTESPADLRKQVPLSRLVINRPSQHKTNYRNHLLSLYQAQPSSIELYHTLIDVFNESKTSPASLQLDSSQKLFSYLLLQYLKHHQPGDLEKIDFLKQETGVSFTENAKEFEYPFFDFIDLLNSDSLLSSFFNSELSLMKLSKWEILKNNEGTFIASPVVSERLRQEVLPQGIHLTSFSQHFLTQENNPTSKALAHQKKEQVNKSGNVLQFPPIKKRSSCLNSSSE